MNIRPLHDRVIVTRLEEQRVFDKDFTYHECTKFFCRDILDGSAK